jgi:hypothetical protein
METVQGIWLNEVVRTVWWTIAGIMRKDVADSVICLPQAQSVCSKMGEFIESVLCGRFIRL